MMNFIKNFKKDEDGAVTVDWVVLTAAVVGLAVAAYSSIESGATGLTDRTSVYGRHHNRLISITWSNLMTLGRVLIFRNAARTTPGVSNPGQASKGNSCSLQHSKCLQPQKRVLSL